jgi:hypothetical protein
MEYPTQHQTTVELLNNEKINIPDLFCKYVASIERFPAESHTQEIMSAMNKRIEEYDEQYQILLNELGVLCSQGQTKADISLVFFQNLLDFFRLAYSVYQEQPEKLEKFASLLHDIQTFLKTKKLVVQGGPSQEALLLQLTKSAWNMTSSEKSIAAVAKQVGGSLKKQTKHKTRKHKQRKH